MSCNGKPIAISAECDLCGTRWEVKHQADLAVLARVLKRHAETCNN